MTYGIFDLAKDKKAGDLGFRSFQIRYPWTHPSKVHFNKGSECWLLMRLSKQSEFERIDSHQLGETIFRYTTLDLVVLGRLVTDFLFRLSRPNPSPEKPLLIYGISVLVHHVDLSPAQWIIAIFSSANVVSRHNIAVFTHIQIDYLKCYATT